MATEWQSIDSAPKDGTRILAIEGTDPSIVPIVVEWGEFEDGTFGWMHSEDVLSDMSDSMIDPIMWVAIPRQDLGD